MSHHHTAQLAEFTAGLKYADIPSTVVDRVKLLALDAIGCGLLGSTMEWSKRLMETLDAIETPGRALVWGTDRRFSAPNAAMANATSVHGFELDDVSHGGHHGSVVMTSGLAIADHMDGLAGQQLIAALVAGVETAARVQSCVGRVPQVTLGFHGPGVVGTFAAAACAGRALGLRASQMVDALGHAGQQTAGLMATQHGGMGKRLLAGKAAHSGTLAALLAAHGFTNVHNIFECEYGGFSSAFTGGGNNYHLDELTRNLGTDWASNNLNFKMWACRVPIHPTLEALKSMQNEEGLRANQVRNVRVWLDEGAYKAVGWAWQPTTPTSAQLNLTYCAAALLLDGDVFVEQFAQEKLADPRVLELIARVQCIHDPDLDAFGSFQQRTRVEVELDDGRVLSRTGKTRTSLGRDNIEQKFEKLTRTLLSAPQQAALISHCARLDTLQDVRQLTNLLAWQN
jgi:aconitate decarboxylase